MGKNVNNERYPDATAILEAALAFRKSKIILTACDINLFDYIGEKRMKAEDIATGIKCNEDALKRLLNALVSMELLVKKNYLYSNSIVALKYLCSYSHSFIGHFIIANDQWDIWSNLTEVVKTGSSKKLRDYSNMPESVLKAHLESDYKTHLTDAKNIADMFRMKDFDKVLDLGCGSGVYAIEFMKRHKGMKVELYDYEAVLGITKQYVDSAGIMNEVEYVAGNFHQIDFGEDYDMIFASFVCDEFSIWENIDLFRKAYSALKQEGLLVIHGNTIDNSRVKPEKSVMHSLELLLNTQKGEIFTENDFWIMIKEAGFPIVDIFETNSYNKLLVGRKSKRLY